MSLPCDGGGESFLNYMKDVSQHEDGSVTLTQKAHPTNTSIKWVHSLFMGLTWSLVILAFVTGGALLVDDVASPLFPGLSHAPISAAPLLLIGAASLAFQVIRRPGLLDLFKAILVSLAFLLWGVDQLLPAGWVATTLGDIVIILYVIALGWMIADTLRARSQKLDISE